MTQHNPLVSIVIPCWNAEGYVGEAIESAVAQTYANVEVIAIDDGSTDGSLEVIRSFGDRVRWELEGRKIWGSLFGCPHGMQPRSGPPFSMSKPESVAGVL